MSFIPELDALLLNELIQCFQNVPPAEWNDVEGNRQTTFYTEVALR
jgi:hypothetical protein